MLSGLIKGILLLALLGFLAWVGLTCYSNFIAKPSAGQADIPDQAEASYSVYVENTGTLRLTNDYEMHGSKVGSRVFILHSFWELRGQKFVYKDSELVLDEGIFGEITIKRRSK